MENSEGMVSSTTSNDQSRSFPENELVSSSVTTDEVMSPDYAGSDQVETVGTSMETDFNSPLHTKASPDSSNIGFMERDIVEPNQFSSFPNVSAENQIAEMDTNSPLHVNHSPVSPNNESVDQDIVEPNQLSSFSIFSAENHVVKTDINSPLQAMLSADSSNIGLRDWDIVEPIQFRPSSNVSAENQIRETSSCSFQFDESMLQIQNAPIEEDLDNHTPSQRPLSVTKYKSAMMVESRNGCSSNHDQSPLVDTALIIRDSDPLALENSPEYTTRSSNKSDPKDTTDQNRISIETNDLNTQNQEITPIFSDSNRADVNGCHAQCFGSNSLDTHTCVLETSVVNRIDQIIGELFGIVDPYSLSNERVWELLASKRIDIPGPLEIDGQENAGEQSIEIGEECNIDHGEVGVIETSNPENQSENRACSLLSQETPLPSCGLDSEKDLEASDDCFSTNINNIDMGEQFIEIGGTAVQRPDEVISEEMYPENFFQAQASHRYSGTGHARKRYFQQMFAASKETEIYSSSPTEDGIDYRHTDQNTSGPNTGFKQIIEDLANESVPSSDQSEELRFGSYIDRTQVYLDSSLKSKKDATIREKLNQFFGPRKEIRVDKHFQTIWEHSFQKGPEGWDANKLTDVWEAHDWGS